MGSFIMRSSEEMFRREPTLKTLCKKFSFLGYIENFSCVSTGSRLHRRRSRLSMMISFHVTPTGNIFKILHDNLKNMMKYNLSF